MKNPVFSDRLLTRRETLAKLRVSASTLRQILKGDPARNLPPDPAFPRPIRPARKKQYWLESELDAWLMQQREVDTDPQQAQPGGGS